MKKLVNNLSIIALLIIGVSFFLPSIMLKYNEDSLGVVAYKEILKTNKNLLEVNDIYLVKAIHGISKSNSQILIVSSASKIIEYRINKDEKDNTEEIKKLAEYNVIKDRLEDTNELAIGIINRHFQTVDSNYTVRNVNIEKDDIKYEFSIESKTGKILNIILSQEDLPENYSTQEILFNYIKYLGLDIIDDWKMEDEILKSQKAELVVTLANDGKNYVLSINTNEFFGYFN